MSHGAYDLAYRRSLEDPESFWAEAAGAIDWVRPWDQVLDRSAAPFYRWFVGGELNTCWNALDRHVAAGRGGDTALIWDSAMEGRVERFTYGALLDRVARFAGGLRALGVERGDRVVIYMPMVPEAVVAMLACARLGAIHSVVFGGFAAAELATRIDHARPKAIVASSCGLEPGRVVAYKPLLDRAIELARHKPAVCVLHERPHYEADLVAGRDHTFAAVERHARVDCVAVEATDPLYVLYTSGTTGAPKGIVRDHGGHAVALAWSLQYIYGMQPGEVFWAASDVGWVVGHSYIVYAPLLCGVTTVLYEGKPVGTPDAGAFWRVVADHGVRTLFTAPTAIRAIKREDPDGNSMAAYDLSRFRALFLAGERCDPDTVHWCERHLKVPVIDHWWQTETGWPISANCLGLESFPIKAGSATKPVPGYDVRVLDDEGREMPAGEIGNVVIRLPLPPGCLPTLYLDDERYREAYLARFEGYYLTGDAGIKDDDGYLWIMSRIDDVINVAGHRLSTGSMEEVLAGHPDVAECAVLGVVDELKGEVPIGFYVVKHGVERPPADLERELVERVRQQIGPVAAFKRALLVSKLPKTRSGKILRGTIKKIADGQHYTPPATIEDPTTLDQIKAALAAAGYPRG
jgi:propionyl-CoA synthetase